MKGMAPSGHTGHYVWKWLSTSLEGHEPQLQLRTLSFMPLAKVISSRSSSYDTALTTATTSHGLQLELHLSFALGSSFSMSSGKGQAVHAITQTVGTQEATVWDHHQQVFPSC